MEDFFKNDSRFKKLDEDKISFLQGDISIVLYHSEDENGSLYTVVIDGDLWHLSDNFLQASIIYSLLRDHLPEFPIYHPFDKK